MDVREITWLYLGSLFEIVDNRGTWYAVIDMIVNLDGDGFSCGEDIKGNYFEIEPFSIDVKIRPILNHVCDMPKHEKKEYYQLCKRIKDGSDNIIYISETPKSIFYLLKHKYDAFDLIETGQAIDMIEYRKFKNNKI